MTNPAKSNNALLVCALALCAVALLTTDGLAQSSLGIGRGEQPLPTGGLFEGFFTWVRNQQSAFHQTMRGILVAMRSGEGSIWPLVWVCFLYGVFHAVGPGHGKVVISSYMLANEVALRRGVAISMAASFMQGVTAIVAIGVFLVLLRGTGIKSGEMTYGLELASYVGVMLVGLWLLWRKAFKRKGHDHTHHHHNHDHDHEHHDHNHHHNHDHGHDHSHAHLNAGEVCDHCGHSHAPDPSTLTGSFGLRQAWAAILAVGLRPCTGALIVLIFCFANSLYVAGIASTLAMSIGTGIAVSAMAIMAGTAKAAALKFAVAQDSVATVTRWIEIAGALFIFLIGFVLFTAAAGF